MRACILAPSERDRTLAEESTLFDGKYTILSKLREGGMGTIYKVHHNLLDEIRVIKFMRAAVTGDPDLHRRFLQEAKLVTRFKHANIAAVYDFAMDDDDTAYIVMEYVGGLNLNEAAAALQPLSVPLVLELVAQTLDALGYLHRKNVVHRDISPDNIMAVVEDDSFRVKLIDLGIAKALDSSEAGTKTGFFLGKLKYASPEQLGTLEGDERMDGRSDLYSLGVVLYELLTGRLPFSGGSAQALIAGHLVEAPASFDVADPEGRVPDPIRGLVLRALAKKRADRFASAEEMRRAIVELQQQFPSSLAGEAARFHGAMVEQEQIRTAAESVTPSAQERMNRRFNFAEATPQPGTVPPLSAGKTLDSTVPARDRPRNARAAPTEKTTASTLDATVAAEPPQSTGGWLGKRWLAVTSTAFVALIAAVGVLVSRKASEPDVAPPAIAAVAMPAEPPAAAPAVVIAETVTTPSAEPATEPRQTRDPLVSAARVTPTVTTAPARPPVTVARTEPAAARPGRETPPVVTQAPPPTVTRTTTVAPPPDPVVRPAESERPRETTPPVVERERPAPPAESAPSAETAVREAIAEFVSAQESLDAGRYVAIFPSANRSRISAAFASFRSQKLDLAIERVEVSGQRATVHAHEDRVAVPKVGSVQRVNTDRVIRLERSAGRWTVVSIQ